MRFQGPRLPFWAAFALVPALWLPPPLPLVAQQAVRSISGTVRDTAGPPLSGANVFVGRRQATTNERGGFRIDSLQPGRYEILIRRLGYIPLRAPLTIEAIGVQELTYVLTPAPLLLPTVVVEGRRTGIYGTVGDTTLHAAVGARVQVVGFRGGDVVTDSLGRFSVPTADQGLYLVRVTFPGFLERRLTVELSRGQGRELAIQLTPGSRPVFRGDEPAFQDLRLRLSMTFRRERLGPEGLARYGTTPLCQVPLAGGGGPIIIINGTDVYRGMPREFLCFWRANDVDLVEFGPDICREPSQTLMYQLNVWCGTSSTATRRRASGQGSPSQGFGRGYIVIWEKR